MKIFTHVATMLLVFSTTIMAQGRAYLNPCDCVPTQGQSCYRCRPTSDAEPQSNPEEENIFVAPPPSGEVSGESSSLGIRGFSIRIPEMSITFPTIQLPSLVKYRRGPEMLTDQGRATFQPRPEAGLQFAREPEPKAEPQSNPEPENKENCYPYPYPPRMPCDQIGETEQLRKQLDELKTLVAMLAQQRSQQQVTSALLPAAYHAPTPQKTAAELLMEKQRAVEAAYHAKLAELDRMKSQVDSVQKEYEAILRARMDLPKDEPRPQQPRRLVIPNDRGQDEYDAGAFQLQNVSQIFN